MKKKSNLATLILTKLLMSVLGQDPVNRDSNPHKKKSEDILWRHSIGSSLFMLGNFAKGDKPNYYQLNYGYKLTSKDIINLEAITWTYYGPLGKGGYSKPKYPGKVRGYGIGIGFQHFWWKNLYTTVQATSFMQQFYDLDKNKIQKGFQLYLKALIGYRFEFFNKRFFIEPAFGIKYWPVNTNFPKAFVEIERGNQKYYFEPSLHFGFRF